MSSDHAATPAQAASVQEEVLQIFRDTGALLTGHFILRSGLRSARFFQCAQLCQYLGKVARLVELLRPKLEAAPGVLPADVVLAPAMGGLVIGQEVARNLGLRFIFAEKENDKLVLRRNFKIGAGERVLVVEDVVTRGGRVLECLDIVSKAGGVTAAVTALVDRSGGAAKFPVPFVSLLEMSFPTYAPDALPAELAALPPVKPGS
ncbi:MAG: orotate phosphoribosyltransferase [Puniceicoccales bacterium]|jgi:orotate phosphoribosyltransferase|nr:orotate phosphoribosyltransferase [Puniceicoccales bacterium]